MNNLQDTPKIVIPYVEGDDIIHTAENGYECDIDPDCICHFGRWEREQEDVGASFLYWSTDEGES